MPANNNNRNILKGALIALFVAILFLLFLFLNLDINKGISSIDIHIHVHDTYFIFSYSYLIFLLVLFLGTFFCVGGLVGSRFKSKLFWALFLLFTLTDIYFFDFLV